MPDATTSSSTSKKSHQALVVRSGPEIDQFLSNLLQQENLEIQFAANNAEALHLAKDRPFDLILTGERTPGKRISNCCGGCGWSGPTRG